MRQTQVLFNMRRKIRLSTKHGPHGYYKGTRTGSQGEHTKWGGYVVNYDKVRSYVAPESLKDCKLTPFVTKKIKPSPGDYGTANGPSTGSFYLNRWKQENGED